MRRTLVAGLLLTVALPAVTFGADSGTGIGFATDGVIEIATGSNASVDVVVCNTDGAVSTFELRLEGFTKATATTSGVTFSDGSSLAIAQSTKPLDSGRCGTQRVTFTRGSRPVAAEGVLLLVAVGSPLQRRSVTLAAAPEAKATKPVGELAMSGSFSDFFGVRGQVGLDTDSVLLRYDGTIEPSIPTETLLGIVAASDDEAEVWTTGEPSVVRVGLLRVPVELRKVSGSGRFSGSLNPEIAGSKDDLVAITVSVRHHWTLAALVFVLGVILSIAARLISGNVLPRKRLAAYRDAVGPRYKRAYESFAALAPARAAGFCPPSVSTVASFTSKIKEATKAYARTTVVFNTSSEAVEAIRKQIASAYADTDLLGSSTPDGLAKRLVALEDRLAVFELFVSERFGGRTPSALVIHAKTALGNRDEQKRTEIQIGGVLPLVSGADSSSTALDQWTVAAERIRRFTVWWKALDDKVADSGERDQLNGARTRLIESIELLKEVSVPGDASLEKVGSRLAPVEAVLGRLGAEHGIWVPRDWEATGRWSDGSDALFELAGPEMSAGSAEHALDGDGPIKVIVKAFELDSAGPKWLVIVLEATALAVGAGFAAAAAARLLYVDKAFGNLSDYFAMFGAGLGSELVATGLLAALASWRPPTATTSKG